MVARQNSGEGIELLISDTVFNRMKELGVSNGVFMFVSNEKETMEKFVLTFAQNLLGYSSEDVALNERIYTAKDGFISAEQVNDFIEFEAKKAVGVPAKILIMYDVDLLKDSVSDKMLKCIEDYSNDSLIIFTTTSPESVSRTIKSRCMVFKSWSDAEDPFITFREKYLSFLGALDTATAYSDVDSIIKDMSDLAVMDVIQALFSNAQTNADLEIAKYALDAHLTGSQPDQVFSYIVNSYWCLHHNLRSWGNSAELGVS